MKSISDRILEKIRTQFYAQKVFHPENCAVCEILWKKFDRTGQATDDNMI
jgi:hypothetical protein